MHTLAFQRIDSTAFRQSYDSPTTIPTYRASSLHAYILRKHIHKTQESTSMKPREDKHESLENHIKTLKNNNLTHISEPL